MMNDIKCVLSVAGSDSSGGAGIQADTKTITALRMFAMTAVTAVTAQNTTGVRAVQALPSSIVAAQIDAVFEDIPPDAVKIGMIGSKEIGETVASSLSRHGARHVVVDPVMVATSGAALAASGTVGSVVRGLFPLAEIITPNIPEASFLAGMYIDSTSAMESAARKIGEFYDGWMLIKGGHLTDTADDLLVRGGEMLWIRGRRVNNPNTHGTGCTLSSAIACFLAEGLSVPDAVSSAKEYITGAIGAGLDLGSGSGPLDHMYRYR